MKDKFFGGMHEKLCDSMRSLHTQPHSTFDQLLESSTLAEKESALRNVTHGKAANVTFEVIAMNDTGAIQSQSHALDQYLEGANFKGT